MRKPVIRKRLHELSARMSQHPILAYLTSNILFLFLLIARLREQLLKKQPERASRVQKEQKEKWYESKLNFYTHIMHELCTPLTLINGAGKYIYDYASSIQDAKLNRYISVLQENVKELNELIQVILDFRKAESDNFSNTQIRNVPIAELIRTQYDWFLPLSEQQQILFKLDTPHGLAWNTDPVYFKKVSTNLISNAFKYTDPGGEIRLTLTADKERLTFKVYNTGRGIKEEDQQVIFDRYHILHHPEVDNKAKNTTRSGLGLFICHRIVQSLRGTIEVRSQAGEFAEFTVTLPHLDIAKAHTPKEEPAEGEEKRQQAMILVVDNHKDITWLIAETLSPTFRIQEAYCVEEALEILKRQTPLLIITDIMMPGTCGLQFISRLKDNKYTRHIPLIIVSAKISDKEQADGLNAGADAYLTKPFSPMVLQSVVNRLINNKEEMKHYFYSPESAIQLSDGQPMHQEDLEFMNTVVGVIRDHISKEGLGPDLIAEALHINTRILYRRFKKISTLTPSDFIKNYRMTYAAQLLVNTQLSIQEIIYTVGLSNKSYFYREFARKYQKTPKEYREQDKTS